MIVASFTLLVAPASATTADKVLICHATSSESNPYVSAFVDMSSVDEENNKYLNGHGDHLGPVFPGKGEDGKWGDIIPPFTYGEVTFLGYNWTDLGKAVYAGGKGCPEVKVIGYLEPTVSPATCEAPGNLTVPPSTEQVTYKVSPAYAEGDHGVFVVTATPGTGYAFEGFTFTKSWELTVPDTLDPNDPLCVETAVPEAPKVKPASCDAAGALLVPAPTASVTYSVAPAYAGLPGTYVVTATASDGYIFAGGQKTKVFEALTVDKQVTVGCTPPPPAAVPVAVTVPTFVKATCEAPNATGMTIPANTSQVTYAASGPAAPGSTITVTATPVGNVVLTGYPAGGWTNTFPTIASLNCTVVAEVEDVAVVEDVADEDTPEEAAVAGSEDELAATGGNTSAALLGALLVLGGAALIGSRRRFGMNS